MANPKSVDRIVTAAAKLEGLEPFEYILAKLRDGVAFLQLAGELGLARATLSTYAHAFPNAADMIAAARQDGTFARIERATQRLADCDETPAAVSKAKAIMDSEQWVAARFNQRTFGDKSTTQLSVSLTAGKGFLEAMRVRRMANTSHARLIEPPRQDDETVTDAIVEDID